jgi:hypothetical protein
MSSSHLSRIRLVGQYRVRAPRRLSSYLTGIALSTAGLVFSACGSSTAPKPRIKLAPPAITLSTTAGGQASGSVSVSNSGGGTLAGMTAAVGAYSAGASNWLTATLATTTAPTSLVLSANALNVSAGSYTAVVNVSAAAASPATQTLTVTLQVSH